MQQLLFHLVGSFCFLYMDLHASFTSEDVSGYIWSDFSFLLTLLMMFKAVRWCFLPQDSWHGCTCGFSLLQQHSVLVVYPLTRSVTGSQSYSGCSCLVVTNKAETNILVPDSYTFYRPYSRTCSARLGDVHTVLRLSSELSSFVRT